MLDFVAATSILLLFALSLLYVLSCERLKGSRR